MAEEETGAAHARLSPSAAERWLTCPASIRMEGQVPKGEESSYAAEGTAAHELGELKAREQLLGAKLTTEIVEFEERNAQYDLEAMHEHCDAYVEFIRERLELVPNSQLLLEQRMPTGIDYCWGTSDAVIVSPEHVEIVDLKYGMGVAVESEDNAQLKLYALGAYDTFGQLLGDVQDVRMSIFQPRLKASSTASMKAADLLAWREEIRPIAEEALAGSYTFGPSESACRWCPAAGFCKAQLEAATAVDFGADLDLVTPEEMAEALKLMPFVKDWAAKVGIVALDMAYSQGRKIPGFKVVRSGGRRFFTDPESAAAALYSRGYETEQVRAPGKLRGFGELEKLVGGRKEFDSIVGPFVAKSEGRESLVPEDDKRPSITPNSEAAEDFTDE